MLQIPALSISFLKNMVLNLLFASIRAVVKVQFVVQEVTTLPTISNVYSFHFTFSFIHRNIFYIFSPLYNLNTITGTAIMATTRTSNKSTNPTIGAAAFNLGSLRFVGMNLGFLLGVNDHRFVINLSNFQFSHLLL